MRPFRSYFNILLFLSTSFITLLECRGLKKSACLGLLCTLHTFFSLDMKINKECPKNTLHTSFM